MERDKKKHNEVQPYLVKLGDHWTSQIKTQNTEAVLFKWLPTDDDIFKQHWLNIFECDTGKVGPCHT